MRSLIIRLAVCALFMASGFGLQAGRRRALLIGINDYTASHLGRVAAESLPPDRDWPNLTGAVNDVTMLREMLTAVYGFAESDVVTLTDQAATRTAILDALDRQLVEPAAKDDVLL